MKKLNILIVASLVLSACAPLPDSVIERDTLSTLQVPQRYSLAQGRASPITSGLLDLFEDEYLRQLVNQATAKNLDIQLLTKQFEEAGFLAQAQGGEMVPKVQAGVPVTRSRNGSGQTSSLFSPSLDVSWEIDLWGKLRDKQHALHATARAKEQRAQAIRDSIAGQVMQGWFDLATAAKIVALEESRVANLQISAANSSYTYMAGLTKFDDLAAVQRDINLAKANLSESIGNKNRAARGLGVLLGQYPDSNFAVVHELPALISPPPAGIPSQLLTGRPDILAAWNEVIAADDSVKISHKQMFPSFSLTGSIGAQSSNLSDLVSNGTVWSLAGNLTSPLFNGGQLEANMNAAQSRAEQAWIQYLQASLTAFKEVEHALDQESILSDKELRQNEAVVYAEQTARVFEERYQSGLVSILELLSAQNAVFDIKKQLLQIRKARLNNRVALGLSLGKGV